jgi:hypothetical protein
MMHAARGFASILVVLALASCPALPPVTAAEPAAAPIVLSARDLYEGFEARKVVLDAAAEKLTLDPRVFSFGREQEGRAVTDVIDLLPVTNGLGDDCRAATAVEVEVSAAVPPGAKLRVEARSGPHFFDEAGWSPWRDLGGLEASLSPLAGRYLQLRLSFTAAAADGLPAVTGVTLRPQLVVRKGGYEPPVTVAAAKVQQIVRSPVQFGYERPDQAKLATFRKENDLDGVAAGKYDKATEAAKHAAIDKSIHGGEDFLQLVRLMDWAAQGTMRNVPGGPQWKDGAYQWDIERVFERTPEGERVVRGHCMSYAQVMVSAATALGYKARHVCAVGFKEMSHEITEVWVPSLGKWVYFDPDLDHYYFDKETRVPVNLVEMHEVVRDKIVPEDKDMHWLMSRSQEPREHVKGIDTKSLIGCRLGSWLAGEKMPADYDWGWKHGYLIAGFVQMTPRNDFHSHPEKIPRNFQQFPGYDDYPFWVDDKTPPRAGVNEWVTRKRDFYWTLDQASLRLIRTGADEVTVELGNSMPFFAHYRVETSRPAAAGQPEQRPTESRPQAGPFIWKLEPGDNRLVVHPVDEFGKEGAPSTVTVRLGR